MSHHQLLDAMPPSPWFAAICHVITLLRAAAVIVARNTPSAMALPVAIICRHKHIGTNVYIIARHMVGDAIILPRRYQLRSRRQQNTMVARRAAIINARQLLPRHHYKHQYVQYRYVRFTRHVTPRPSRPHAIVTLFAICHHAAIRTWSCHSPLCLVCHAIIGAAFMPDHAITPVVTLMPSRHHLLFNMPSYTGCSIIANTHHHSLRLTSSVITFAVNYAINCLASRSLTPAATPLLSYHTLTPLRH